MAKIQLRKKKPPYKLIIFIITFVTVIFLIDIKTRPTIIKMCNFQINQFASEKIGASIEEAIEEMGYNYEDYVTIHTSKDDKIIAINTNAKKITAIHNLIKNKIGKAISQIKSQNVYINVGSLTGISWLSGIGPEVSIKVISKGISSSEIKSSLEEAGINQTLHKIHIDISVKIAGFLPGYSTETETKSDYMLSESLIVGAVPSHYTNIISDDKISNLEQSKNIETQ